MRASELDTQCCLEVVPTLLQTVPVRIARADAPVTCVLPTARLWLLTDAWLSPAVNTETAFLLLGATYRPAWEKRPANSA